MVGSYSDDFSDYSDGNLDLQGCWRKYGSSGYGDICVSNGNDWVYGCSPWNMGYYYCHQTIIPSGYKREIYMKSTVRIDNGGYIYVGFGDNVGDTNFWEYTGIYITEYDNEMYFNRFVDGVGVYMATKPINTGNINIEFKIDYKNSKYVFIKCPEFDIDVTNVSGSSDTGNSKRAQITSNGVSDSKCLYIEYKSWVDSVSYLKYPRWQKTKYGLRPFY